MQTNQTLSYDVVKIILEIKYSNWLKEKQCVCGNHDFKECEIAECHGCINVYCRKQPGWENWMWECRDCYDWFCGKHDFYITPAYRKICIQCIGGLYEVPQDRQIPTVPEKQWDTYMTMIENEWKRAKPPVYNSPEY